MKAIRYYGPGDVRLDEIPEPQIGDRQVKIKVLAFLCHMLYRNSFNPFHRLPGKSSAAPYVFQ